VAGEHRGERLTQDLLLALTADQYRSTFDALLWLVCFARVSDHERTSTSLTAIWEKTPVCEECTTRAVEALSALARDRPDRQTRDPYMAPANAVIAVAAGERGD
jgi:hypothetical protein